MPAGPHRRKRGPAARAAARRRTGKQGCRVLIDRASTAAASQRAGLAPEIGLLGAVAVYTCGFLLWYSATPLGLYPVLDAREIIALAQQMAAGDVPAEPFYRAPLYPFVLASMLQAGIEPAHLPLVARALNGVLHLASTVLCLRLAAHLWRSRGGALLAAALYGFNPVVLHFVADPLDITLAIFLLLAALWCGRELLDRGAGGSPLPAGAAALLLGLATAVRPHCLSVAVAWLVLCLWRDFAHRAVPLRTVAAGAGIAIVLAALGGINSAVGGDFRILPWQGAYNLWAANKPGAHGRYFEQTAALRSYDETINTARVESEMLYRRARPQGPFNPASMSAYWRDRFGERVATAPGEVVRAIAAKSFWLVNNFEQYNNKTYRFHKQRSPWLAWNPLCWSLVLGLALCGLATGWRRPPVRALALVAFAYAAGVVLFYVSARFRLPLVALLAVVAGGAPAFLRALGGERQAAHVAGAVAIAAVVAVSLYPLPPAQARKTEVQDWLLVARAASESADYALAHEAARGALAIRATPVVREMLCVTAFNAVAARAFAPGVPSEQALAATCAAAPPSPATRFIKAVIAWRNGQSDEAIEAWTTIVRSDSPQRADAIAALLFCGRLSVGAVAAPGGMASLPDPVVIALALRGSASARAEAEARFEADYFVSQAELMRRMFERVSRPPAD